MIKRRVHVDLGTFPPPIRHLLTQGNVYDSSCSSDALVYYVDTGCYIKVDAAGALKDESHLTQLFHQTGLGVEVLDYVSADRDYLVTKSALGEDLTHLVHDPVQTCRILASALRTLHATPLPNFPVSFKVQHFLDSAGSSLSSGHYDPFVLMDRFRIQSREEAWHIMQSGKHLLSTDTLIHGDACLPNILQKDGRFTSFIDFSLAGAGNKHIDLYWALWSLQYNLKTDAYADLFLDLYGRDCVNPDMLRVIAAFEFFG